MDLKEEPNMRGKISDHWYYYAKGQAMLKMLSEVECREILDIGAGSGVFSEILIAAGRCQSAICVDNAYSCEENVVFGNGKISYRRTAQNVSRPVVLMMDVLEHVEDDKNFLGGIIRTAPSGAHFLISVPAFQLLWSGHDVFLDHKRRYSSSGLTGLVRTTGLEVVDARYFFCLILPVVAIRRWTDRLTQLFAQRQPVSSMKSLPAVANRILKAIHTLELRHIFPWNRYCGLTVFCLARKL